MIKNKYIISFVPIRKIIDSVILVAKVNLNDNKCYGELIEYKKLCNCNKSIEVIQILKELVLKYNNSKIDYENIESINIDSGAGGSGILIGDYLLEDWYDKNNIKHKGFIDKNCKEYQGYDSKYSNASNILHFYSMHKDKSELINKFNKLISDNSLKFIKELEMYNQNIEKNKRIIIDDELLAILMSSCSIYNMINNIN